MEPTTKKTITHADMYPETKRHVLKGEIMGHGSNRKYFTEPGSDGGSFFDTAGAYASAIGEIAGEDYGKAKKYFNEARPGNYLKKAWGGAKIAANNAYDRPGETARDMGRGVMAGLASTASGVTGGFGLLENDVSRAAEQSADWWRNGIEDKNSIGGAVADEATQWMAAGPAFKALKYGVKGGKALTGLGGKLLPHVGGKTIGAGSAMALPVAVGAVNAEPGQNTKPFTMANKPVIKNEEQRLKDKAIKSLEKKAMDEADGIVPEKVIIKKTAPGSKVIVTSTPKSNGKKKSRSVQVKKQVPEDILDLF